MMVVMEAVVANVVVGGTVITALQMVMMKVFPLLVVAVMKERE